MALYNFGAAMTTPTGEAEAGDAAVLRSTLGLDVYNDEEDDIEEDESSREEEQEARSTAGATLAKASAVTRLLLNHEDWVLNFKTARSAA